MKLIDFGIAKAIPNDTTNIHRDHQTGTVNYMAPEAITFVEGHDKDQYLKVMKIRLNELGRKASRCMVAGMHFVSIGLRKTTLCAVSSG